MQPLLSMTTWLKKCRVLIQTQLTRHRLLRFQASHELIHGGIDLLDSPVLGHGFRTSDAQSSHADSSEWEQSAAAVSRYFQHPQRLPERLASRTDLPGPIVLPILADAAL